MKKNLLPLLGLLIAGSLMSPAKKETYIPPNVDVDGGVMSGAGRGTSSPRSVHGSPRGGHVSHRSTRGAHSPVAPKRSKSPARRSKSSARHARVSHISLPAVAGAGSSAKPATTPKHLKATKHAHEDVLHGEATFTRAPSVGALRGTRSSHLARAGRTVVGGSVHDEVPSLHHVVSLKRSASPKRGGATVGSLRHKRLETTRADLHRLAIKGVPAPRGTVDLEEDTSPLG